MEFIKEFMVELISSVSSTACQDTASETWVASFQVLPVISTLGQKDLAFFCFGHRSRGVGTGLVSSTVPPGMLHLTLIREVTQIGLKLEQMTLHWWSISPRDFYQLGLRHSCGVGL